MSLRSALERNLGLDGDPDDSLLDRLEDVYVLPTLGVLFAFMLWIRVQAYDNFVVDGEIYLRGNDAWYHYRETNYILENWPFTMGFDPWTGFPHGTSAEQFGTLFDQIAATLMLVLMPIFGEQVVGQIMLVFVPILGSLVIIPVYFLGKHFGGRLAGVFAAFILALLPGTFLNNTLVGFFDHHAGEVLFQAIAVLAFVGALAIAERHAPVWELVVDRDVEALKTPGIFAALAGVAGALYMWVWPPGVLLVGFTGIYFAIAIVSDVANDRSPEPTAFVGAVSMTVMGLLMLVPLNHLSIGGATDYSLLQVLLALGVAAGCLFLAWLAREWESRDVQTDYYPPAVFGLVILSLGLFALVLPNAFGSIQSQVLSTIGFSQGAGTRTISEAQPFLAENTLNQLGVTATGRILGEYGMTLFTGVIAAAWMLGKPLIRSDDSRETYYVIGSLVVVGIIFAIPGLHRAIAGAIGIHEQLFALLIVAALLVGATLQHRYAPDTLYLLVWAAFITAAAFTQVRFNYYLAVVVAVMNGYLLVEVLKLVNLRRSLSDIVDIDNRRLNGVQGWQVLTIFAVVAIVLGPVLLVGINVAAVDGQERYTETAWESGAATGPGPVTAWDHSLQWMSEETPYPGTYGGADNEMEYYGTYEWPEDNDFDYPEGAYGVMSWWDYGHWITTRAERIPNANPFQQGATTAANYLLAPDEASAEAVLDGQSDADEPTRFVMVDWQMVALHSKFNAPVTFYDEEELEREDFAETVFVLDDGQAVSSFQVRNQRYYESQMVRLYYFHGSAQEPQPVVLDWEERQFQNPNTGETTIYSVVEAGSEDPPIRTFDSMEEAREYADERDTAQVGGFGPYPEERVDALEHYRLVKIDDTPAGQQLLQSDIGLLQVTGIQDPSVVLPDSPQWLKTFERVPGATIEGSNAPAGSTVTAEVQMEIPTTNETFTYTQQTEADENGEFTMIVPYSTTDYEEYGPENGYTNVSVQATGPYTISTPPEIEDGQVVQNGAEVEVSEGKVVGDDPDPVEVTLEERAEDLQIQPDDGEDADIEDDGIEDDGET